MKNLLNSLLPANIRYNMTVFNMTQTGEIVMEVPLGESISNASPEDFSMVKEAAAADITYTTRNRWVLKIHLEVGRG